MATLDELELRLRALEQAQAAEPTSYYTSIFSGEEMDQRLAAAGVLGTASTPQAALAALGASVRPNLLDNACFVGGGTGWGVFPVNQRGKASYGAGPAFDRWGVNGGTVTLKSSGVSWESGWVLNQAMSGLNLADGKTRTVSYVDENNHGFSGILTKNYTTIGDYMFTFSTGTRFYAQALPQSPAMAFAKLEDGDDQTLFVENGDGTVTVLPQNLNYRRELAKCQAYQIELNYRKLQNPTIGTVTRGPGSWYVAIPLPTTMRTAPSIKIERGTATVECPDGAFQVSQLTPLSITSSMALFVLKFSGGSPTTASSGTLYVAGTGTGADAPSVILDANL